eukprot:CAMPEP_0174931058 /NCGR_PEP_ID=MMETSP1355-20121228/32121_1 /TAXON_ID=464990 /ORGANISM="Hemiselmis tepida, Strain CCMP443" /LENGTH=83 /DNA_ID=CAMNT_0016177381 /DNA_START=104 /DNA_END=352 /DNA_ORIENTATION=-
MTKGLRKYNAEIGKLANSVVPVKGKQITVDTGLDAGGRGEKFVISTNVDTAFACGKSCKEHQVPKPRAAPKPKAPAGGGFVAP